MTQFLHPSKDDINLAAILNALSDPVRIRIIKGMLAKEGCMSCSEATPCPDMAKSTLSNHFRILREAGLIRTIKKGIENRNTVRIDDINDRFPDLLQLILKLAD